MDPYGASTSNSASQGSTGAPLLDPSSSSGSNDNLGEHGVGLGLTAGSVPPHLPHQLQPQLSSNAPNPSSTNTSQQQAPPVRPSSSTSNNNNNNSTNRVLPAGFGSKAERFLITAADQTDGTRDERLRKVIHAKYDAGLLKPYNYVNGYARLNRWMEKNVSPQSRRRILKPLSVFRPAFRAIAQSLTNVDLLIIEEHFERLLLDYDRVFSTQGIPACLWRRTGEIYKGNKEFANLIGVNIDSLR
ncbi:unnamed protein product, partial [Tilletia laevis]